MFKGALVLSLILIGGSAASAAIIYEPVQYQYGAGAQTYYYGGRHPQMAARAAEHFQALRSFDPNYQPNNFIIHTDRTPAVYSDAAPGVNLTPYGYTPTDAMNEANANLPRYFRKSDILAAGKVTADGSLVIRADAQPVARPVIVAPTTQAAHQAIIIIPRRPAAAPAKAAADLKVADAR